MNRLQREAVIVLAAFALLLAFMLLMTGGAGAQTAGGGQCAARDKVTAVLNARYHEVRHGMGLAANNTVMELWASAESGTWTITVTMPSGVTCMVASGQGFETMSEPLPPPGDAL